MKGGVGRVEPPYFYDEFQKSLYNKKAEKRT